MNEKYLYINGRIFSHSLSGIPIYAREIIKYFDKEKILYQIISPKEHIRGINGHLWEQIILPQKIKKNSLLWNPAGTGPIYYPNQITTIHDISPIVHKEWFSKKYALWYQFITPSILKKSKKIITISEFSKSEILRVYKIDEKKIKVIYNGFQKMYRIIEFGNQENEKIRNSIPGNYFLYVGTIEPRKNINIILKAWEKYMKAKKDNFLVIIGSKDSGKVFAEYKLEKNNNNIIIKGYVPNEEMPYYYGNALALIYPSLYEGFGLPPLEAIACGTNIIISDIPVHKEIYKNIAFYFNPHNYNELLEIMINIEKIKFEREKLAIYAQNYNIEKNCENTLKTIMGII